MKIVAQAEGGMTEKGDKYDLVSASLLQAHVDETPRRRKQRAVPPPCTLRLELLDTEGQLISPAFFGCSCALDGLEDKDELVRTFQRCRADHLQFSPPSVLIKWDVQESECHNMLKELPALSEVTSKFAVLKEPMGSRGEGIYFVQSVEEMYRIIKEHRDRALHEGDDFLDNVMAHKGRIPSWVLQAEIFPPLLIRGRRKFHIRTYAAAIERLHQNHLLDVYLFTRHEVRIAPVPVDTIEDTTRHRDAHITNGALRDTTERVLLHDVEELAGQQKALELFCAKIFSHLMPDCTRRVGYSAGEYPPDIQKFTFAGLDIMMTDDMRFYLLEVNVNPAAPPEDCVTPEFKDHLVGMMTDLTDLVLGKRLGKFVLSDVILEQNGNM